VLLQSADTHNARTLLQDLSLSFLRYQQQQHPFNGPLSRTTRVSQYQKGKPIWILLKQETVSGSGISWTICKSAPCSWHNHASTIPLSFFTGRMPFLSPSEQHQISNNSKNRFLIGYIYIYALFAISWWNKCVHVVRPHKDKRCYPYWGVVVCSSPLIRPLSPLMDIPTTECVTHSWCDVALHTCW